VNLDFCRFISTVRGIPNNYFIGMQPGNNYYKFHLYKKECAFSMKKTLDLVEKDTSVRGGWKKVVSINSDGYKDELSSLYNNITNEIYLDNKQKLKREKVYELKNHY